MDSFLKEFTPFPHFPYSLFFLFVSLVRRKNRIEVRINVILKSLKKRIENNSCFLSRAVTTT